MYQIFESRERRAELLPRVRKIHLANAKRKNILGAQYGLLQELLKRFSNTDKLLELEAGKAGFYQKRRKIITKTIDTAEQFCTEVGHFLAAFNSLKKPEIPDDEMLYLACICSRVTAALRFISNERNAYKYNNHCFVVAEKYETMEEISILKFNSFQEEYDDVIYNIGFHQQNLKEIQKLISNLSGHRWESVRNVAFALAASLAVTSIALALAGSIGVMIIPMLLGASALSGIGFFAAQDTGVARTVRQLELKAMEFPSV